jgi:hypothetical protein
MKQLKRNQVVTEARKGHFMPGRINRIIAHDLYEVVDCGCHIRLYRGDQINVVPYKGRLDDGFGVRRKFPVYRNMPSLRRLKQKAAEYDKSIWKKHRFGPLPDNAQVPPDLTPIEGRYTYVFQRKGWHWFSGCTPLEVEEAIVWCHHNVKRFDVTGVWMGVYGEIDATSFRLRWC